MTNLKNLGTNRDLAPLRFVNIYERGTTLKQQTKELDGK